MIPAGLKPIGEAPKDRPILAYLSNYADPQKRFAVMYWDDGAHLWRTVHGRDFIGPPTHYKELDFQ